MSQVPPNSQNPTPRYRHRLAPAALVAGVVATGALALATTGTLSAFTASITNSVNSAATGSLTMQETGPGKTGTPVSCTSTDNGTNNAATCATINKYSGSTALVPGAAPITTTVTLTNTGSVTATTFTVGYGTCVNGVGPNGTTGGTGKLCDSLNVAVTTGTAPGTALAAASGAPSALNGKTITIPGGVVAGASVTVNFAVSVPLAADNTLQNLSASQPITWTFTS
jgi:hypothetical protein